MPKVQVVSQVDIDTEKVLEGVNQLGTSELEQFAQQVNTLVARRKAPSLSQKEVELLQKINQSLPTGVRERYRELNEKLHDETITPEEHREFLGLINQVELSDAERLRSLIELAQLRGVDLDSLMKQLGIRPPEYA